MTQSELDKQNIQTDYGIFTPLYTCDSIEPIKDEQGNTIDYELVGYVQTKTAEEVYQKYLADKANPPTPEPTEIEKVQQQLDAILLALVEV